MTELKFDTDSSTPKLLFRPLRMLEQGELVMALEAQKDEATTKLITLSVKPKQDTSVPQLTSGEVSNTVPEKPSFFAEAEDGEKDIAEPKVKVSKKKKEAPAPDVDLSSLLDEFDD